MDSDRTKALQNPDRRQLNIGAAGALEVTQPLPRSGVVSFKGEVEVMRSGARGHEMVLPQRAPERECHRRPNAEQPQ